jgi:threonyl-tRNA synthetase
VGDKEIEESAVNVRIYGEQKSDIVSFKEFMKSITEEISIRAIK